MGDRDMGELAHMEIESGVSMFTGEGFCAIRQFGTLSDGTKVTLVGQLSPDDVRAAALNWLGAAEAAESDAGIFAVLTKELELPPEQVGFVISALREWRAARDES